MRAFPFLFAICVMALGPWPGVAHSRGYRIDQVPGGYVFECYMCHFRQPFTRLTVFGEQVRETLLFRGDYPDDLPPNFFVGPEGNVDWQTVALLDADGDGYTNGEELGDPMGLFVQLDEQPDFPFTRPDLPDDFPCGSGTVEGPEACDGEAFGDATCLDYGFFGGALRCRDDCIVDTAACNLCGNGMLDEGEACDGEVEAPCPDGLVGELRCVDCAIDDGACVVPPDASPPDMALPDLGAPDADFEADAGPDAMPDAMPDVILDASGDVMPNASVDATSDAMPDVSLDAMPDAGAPRAPDTAEPGCRAAQVPVGGGGAWLLLAALLIRRRRC